MEELETSAESATTGQTGSELVRPVQGRMLAGVSQGIAHHFHIDPWIPRVLFVVTAFIGGLGVALYAAGWAFIRSEDETESMVDRLFAGTSTSGSWLGLGLMVLAGIIVLSNFTFLSDEVVWAMAVLVVGLLLYLGYIPSRRGRSEALGPPGTEVSESKEGVQRMTTTETPPQPETEVSGDSPIGGVTPPPAQPTPTPPQLPPQRPRERSILGRLTLGVMLLGMGVLAVLDNVDTLPLDAEPRHYLALAVTILGVGLLVGSIAGRARWLILVGAILVPTLMFSPVFEYSQELRRFDFHSRPTTFAELESSYHIDAGALIIDLTELPWDGEEVVIDTSIDMGNLEIYLPNDVGLVGSASVDIGHVSGPGGSSWGLRDPRLDWNEEGTSGTVLLDAHVSLGNIDIRR